MSDVQRKNILKTVLIIVAIMVTILLLFLNKITTPRYLSDIELKINKLELVKEPVTLQASGNQWSLLASTAEQKAVLAELMPELRPHIQEKTHIITIDSITGINSELPFDPTENIGIANTEGKLIAYFKPPFDQHKMILTYSSLITHR
jgi:hypothetical protein